MNYLIRIISTFFYLGYFPKIPGTIGTLGGLTLYILLNNFFNFNVYSMCIFTLILIIVSIISSSYAIKVFNNNDPKEVVIDEVAGYFVSVLFLPFDYNLIIIAFILFRLFDIYKPFLVKKLEDLKGGLGITLDDVGAGVLTNILIQFMIY